MREIIQGYKPHFAGEREVVNWTRPNGTPTGETFFNVPIMYLREVTRDDFIAEHPEKEVSPLATCYWEVSID